MRRTLRTAACLTLALALAPRATPAGTTASVSVALSNAPPAPVIAVRESPRVVCIEGSGVYVVTDPRVRPDCFRYGVWWYVYSDGWWYRAHGHEGPYAVIEPRAVPRAILNVPPDRWKHHPHGGPPGQLKKQPALVAQEERRTRHGH